MSRGRIALLAVSLAAVVALLLAGTDSDVSPERESRPSVAPTPPGSAAASATPPSPARAPARSAAIDDPSRGPSDRAGTAPSGRPARIQVRDEPRPGGAIRGRVALPSRLAGRRGFLQWALTCRADDGEGEHTRSWTLPLRTAEDGSYALGGLGAGRYALSIGDDGAALSETRRVSLADGESRDGVDFEFVRRACVRGVVIADDDEAEVESALVRVDDEVAERTDAAGAFTLYDLEEGEHDVLVTHAELAPARLRILTGAAPSTLRVALEAGAQARILISEADGRPAPGRLVTLFGSGHLAGATTGTDGIAIVRGLAPRARYVVDAPDAEPGLLLASADAPARCEVMLVFRR